MAKLAFTAKLGRAALAIALTGAAASVSANVLVVRALGPAAKAYPPGRSLPDNATLALGAGDTVVLLGPQGTRTFRGPGRFQVSAPVTVTRYTDALRQRPVRARVGAVRGVGGPALPDIWQVDVARGGTVCVVPGQAPALRHTDAGAAPSLTLARAGGAGAVPLQWQAGSQLLAWPAALPVEPGVDYELAAAGRAPVRLRFATIAPASAAPQDLAAALIEQGCQAQLDLLLTAIPGG